MSTKIAPNVRHPRGTRIRVVSGGFQGRRAEVIKTHYGSGWGQLEVKFDDGEITRVDHYNATTDLYTPREKALHDVLGWASSAKTNRRSYYELVDSVVKTLRDKADEIERETQFWTERRDLKLASTDEAGDDLLSRMTLDPVYAATNVLHELAWMTPNSGAHELPNRAARWAAAEAQARAAVDAFLAEYGEMTDEELTEYKRWTRAS